MELFDFFESLKPGDKLLINNRFQCEVMENYNLDHWEEYAFAPASWTDADIKIDGIPGKINLMFNRDLPKESKEYVSLMIKDSEGNNISQVPVCSYEKQI